MLRIIVPARDEASRIEKTIRDLCGHFGSRASILVVANGCSDNTADIVRSLRERFAQLSLLVIDVAIGKGGAIRAGLTIGHSDYVAFVDADGSTSASELDRLFAECAREGIAGAIGSRWLPGSRIERRQSLLRRIASRVFNSFVRCLFAMPFSDTQCGAKVFRRDAIDAVIEKLELANFALDVDLLFSLRKGGFEVVELPIAWHDVPENSKVDLVRAGLPMVLAVLRLRLRHSFFRNVPFLDLLARSHVMPVIGTLNVLAILGSSRTTPFDALLGQFEARGHRIRRLAFVGPFAAIRLGWHIATVGSKKYDLILDATSPQLSRFVSKASAQVLEAKEFELMSATEVSSFLWESTSRRGYRAVLRHDDDGWSIASKNPRMPLFES